MTRSTSLMLLAAGALLAGIASMAVPQKAEAVVYCKTVGVPKGCVARPTGAVRYCTRPGYPVGCTGGVGRVGVGAPGVGVAPMNRGGPVNRVGVR